jgi:hypothetical protein
LYRRELAEAARQRALAPEDLEPDVRSEIFERSLASLQGLVTALSGEVLSHDEMAKAIAEEVGGMDTISDDSVVANQDGG